MKIGALTTGAGVVTTITRPYTPSLVLIGTVDGDQPLTDLSVTIGGDVTIKISGQTHIEAFAKYLMECLLGADVKVGMVLKIANDFMAGQNFELSLTNDGVTTPDVFGFSEGRTNAVPVMVGQQTLQATDSIRYDGLFTALIFPVTNFDYAQLEFADGHGEGQLSAVELATMFSMKNQADADGYLSGMVVIDNADRNITGVTLYTDSGGTLTVTQVTLV